MEKVQEGIKERTKITFKSSDKIKYAVGCTTSVILGKKNVSVAYIWTNRQSYEL